MAKEKKRESIAEYISKSAKSKGKTPAEWMKGAIENASSYLAATHAAKFTNPAIPYTISLYDTSEPIGDGYLSTADTEKIEDTVMSSGTNITLASFLNRKFQPEDDEEPVSVSDLLKEDHPCIKDAFTSLGIDYEKTKANILAAITQKAPAPTATSSHLKQVYFPVGDGEYHLLSILPSISLLCQVKEKLRQDEKKKNKCRSKDSPEFGKPSRRLLHPVRLSFGDGKPQNISAKAMSEHDFYALPSIPPTLDRNHVDIPKGESFFYSLSFKNFYNDFDALQRLILQKMRNDRSIPNLDFAECRDSYLSIIIDRILLRAIALSEKDAGWSDRTELNKNNRIWLDKKYADERGMDDEWLTGITHEFARWFATGYKKTAKFHHRKSVALGDAELRYVALISENPFAGV